MNWTDERVELLKKLWTEDGLTANQIAQQLGGGITRNAVIGKVHRLGLSGRAKTVSQAPRAARPKQKPAAQMQRPMSRPISFGATALKLQADVEAEIDVVAQTAVMIPFPAPTNEKVNIMELGYRTCRWPIGDPVASDFGFCGAESTGEKPYCPYHCAVAYQPSNERRRQVQRDVQTRS